MARFVVLVFLSASLGLWGQTAADDSAKEIALLKRTVAERRIATLERTVRSLQTTASAAAQTVRPNCDRSADAVL